MIGGAGGRESAAPIDRAPIEQVTMGNSKRSRLRLAPLMMVAVMLAAWPQAAMGVWVYFTTEEVLQVAFAPDERVVRIALEKVVHHSLRLDTERKLGYALVFPFMACYQGSRGGQVTGYACIDNVIGRYRPITFMIKFKYPDEGIAWYEVMVYREAVGRGVRAGPFREQFLGKTIADEMRYGKDVRMIVGATLTSDHLLRAFRKHLFLYNYIFKALPVLPEPAPGSITDMLIQDAVR